MVALALAVPVPLLYSVVLTTSAVTTGESSTLTDSPSSCEQVATSLISRRILGQKKTVMILNILAAEVIGNQFTDCAIAYFSTQVCRCQ